MKNIFDLIFQLLMAGILLLYVIRRARAELNKTVQELDVPNSNAAESSIDLSEKGELQTTNGISARNNNVTEYFDDPDKARANSV